MRSAVRKSADHKSGKIRCPLLGGNEGTGCPLFQFLPALHGVVESERWLDYLQALRRHEAVEKYFHLRKLSNAAESD